MPKPKSKPTPTKTASPTPASADGVLRKLEALADPRAVRAWAKMGVKADRYLGVNLTKLKVVAKEVKKSHALALELWATKIHDARLLATMIEEPKQVTRDQVAKQQPDLRTVDLADKYAANVVARTPFARDTMLSWMKSKEDIVRRAGFTLLRALAGDRKTLGEDELLAFVDEIEKRIHKEKNWTKEGMNNALLAIGLASERLHERALEAARKIGKVDVDYGDTSCEPVDVVKHLTDPRNTAKLE